MEAVSRLACRFLWVPLPSRVQFLPSPCPWSPGHVPRLLLVWKLWSGPAPRGLEQRGVRGAAWPPGTEALLEANSVTTGPKLGPTTFLLTCALATPPTYAPPPRLPAAAGLRGLPDPHQHTSLLQSSEAPDPSSNELLPGLCFPPGSLPVATNCASLCIKPSTIYDGLIIPGVRAAVPNCR